MVKLKREVLIILIPVLLLGSLFTYNAYTFFKDIIVIKVRAIDKYGKPVGGAHVFLWLPNPPSYEKASCLIAKGITDNNGIVVFRLSLSKMYERWFEHNKKLKGYWEYVRPIVTVIHFEKGLAETDVIPLPLPPKPGVMVTKTVRLHKVKMGKHIPKEVRPPEVRPCEVMPEVIPTIQASRVEIIYYESWPKYPDEWTKVRLAYFKSTYEKVSAAILTEGSKTFQARLLVGVSFTVGEYTWKLCDVVYESQSSKAEAEVAPLWGWWENWTCVNVWLVVEVVEYAEMTDDGRIISTWWENRTLINSVDWSTLSPGRPNDGSEFPSSITWQDCKVLEGNGRSVIIKDYEWVGSYWSIAIPVPDSVKELIPIEMDIPPPLELISSLISVYVTYETSAETYCINIISITNYESFSVVIQFANTTATYYDPDHGFIKLPLMYARTKE